MPRRRQRSSVFGVSARAFSLLELAIAIAVALLLLGVGLFASRGPLDRVRLESAADTLETAVLLARAGAASESAVVEILVVPSSTANPRASIVVRRVEIDDDDFGVASSARSQSTRSGRSGLANSAARTAEGRDATIDSIALPAQLTVVDPASAAATNEPDHAATRSGVSLSVTNTVGGSTTQDNLENAVRVAFVLPDGSVVPSSSVDWTAGRDTERVTIDPTTGRVTRREINTEAQNNASSAGSSASQDGSSTRTGQPARGGR